MNRMSVGIIVDNLKMGHMNIVMLNSINNLYKTNPEIDVQIFMEERGPIPIAPSAPINTLDILGSWEHPIISTSTNTLMTALLSRSNMILNYIFDLDFLHKKHISFSSIINAISHPKVVNVTRNNLYRSIILEQFANKCFMSDKDILDFDITEFIKIIGSHSCQETSKN